MTGQSWMFIATLEGNEEVNKEVTVCHRPRREQVHQPWRGELVLSQEEFGSGLGALAL